MFQRREHLLRAYTSAFTGDISQPSALQLTPLLCSYSQIQPAAIASELERVMHAGAAPLN